LGGKRGTAPKLLQCLRFLDREKGKKTMGWTKKNVWDKGGGFLFGALARESSTQKRREGKGEKVGQQKGGFLGHLRGGGLRMTQGSHANEKNAMQGVNFKKPL